MFVDQTFSENYIKQLFLDLFLILFIIIMSSVWKLNARKLNCYILWYLLILKKTNNIILIKHLKNLLKSHYQFRPNFQQNFPNFQPFSYPFSYYVLDFIGFTLNFYRFHNNNTFNTNFVAPFSLFRSKIFQQYSPIYRPLGLHFYHSNFFDRIA